MSKHVKIGNQSIIHFRDNMSGMASTLDKGTVALTFTSPPYFNYIQYEGGKGVGNRGETYEEYMKSLGHDVFHG